MKIKNIIKEEVGTKVNNKKMDTIDDTFKLMILTLKILQKVSRVNWMQEKVNWNIYQQALVLSNRSLRLVEYIGGYNYVPQVLLD